MIVGLDDLLEGGQLSTIGRTDSRSVLIGELVLEHVEDLAAYLRTSRSNDSARGSLSPDGGLRGSRCRSCCYRWLACYVIENLVKVDEPVVGEDHDNNAKDNPQAGHGNHRARGKKNKEGQNTHETTGNCESYFQRCHAFLLTQAIIH
jgi:hypothetical protein